MAPIVTISATSRPNNYTSRALNVVNQRLRDDDADVITFDGRDLNLNFPGHDQTDDAHRLREAVDEAVAVTIATPEYHGSFSAFAKLVIENLGFPSVLEGKPMSLLGVAAGRIGAIKSLEQLRNVCAHVGAVVLPGSVSVAGVRNAFDDQGRCTDDDVAEMLEGLADDTLEFIDNYIRPRHILENQIRADEDASPWSTNL